MPSMSRRLECAETWAGNERTASLVELPGVVAWVHSVPAGPDTDGVSEATNPAGEELGRDGLMNIAREIDSSSAEAFGTELASALRAFRDGIEPADDETIIVLQPMALDGH